MIKRLLNHLFTPHWVISRPFPKSALSAIEAAIAASEKTHDGELRFAVEAGLDPRALCGGMSARRRAEALFSSLRVWDTEDRKSTRLNSSHSQQSRMPSSA